MKEQIEQLIADIEAKRFYAKKTQVRYADQRDLAASYKGEVAAYNGILDRLRAILSDSDASDGEKGSTARVDEV